MPHGVAKRPVPGWRSVLAPGWIQLCTMLLVLFANAPAWAAQGSPVAGWRAYGFGTDPDSVWYGGLDLRLSKTLGWAQDQASESISFGLAPSLIGDRAVFASWASLRVSGEFTQLSYSVGSETYNPLDLAADLRTAFLDFKTPIGMVRAGQIPTVWNDVREAAFFDPGLGPPLSRSAGYFAPAGLGLGYDRVVGLGSGLLRTTGAAMSTEGTPLAYAFPTSSSVPAGAATGASVQGSVQYDTSDSWWRPGLDISVFGRHNFLLDDQAGIALALHNRALWFSAEAIASASTRIGAGAMVEARWYMTPLRRREPSFFLVGQGQETYQDLASSGGFGRPAMLHDAFGIGFSHGEAAGENELLETNSWSPQGVIEDTGVELVLYAAPLGSRARGDGMVPGNQ